MKKLLVVLVLLIAITAVFAQARLEKG